MHNMLALDKASLMVMSSNHFIKNQIQISNQLIHPVHAVLPNTPISIKIGISNAE